MALFHLSTGTPVQVAQKRRAELTTSPCELGYGEFSALPGALVALGVVSTTDRRRPVTKRAKVESSRGEVSLPSLVHFWSSLDNDWRVQLIVGPALWDSALRRAPVVGGGGALWRQVV